MQQYLAEVDGIAAGRIFSFPMGIGSAPRASPELVLEDRTEVVPPGRQDNGLAGSSTLFARPASCSMCSKGRAAVPGAALLVLTYQQDERRAAFETDADPWASGRRDQSTAPLRGCAPPGVRRCRPVAVSAETRARHVLADQVHRGHGARKLPVVGNEEVVEHVRLLRRDRRRTRRPLMRTRLRARWCS